MLILYEPESLEFAELLSRDLGCEKIQLNIPQFPNGEFKIEPIYLDKEHVLVICSTVNDINSQLLKYFLILQNLQDVEIIDVFMPYIQYSRQDKSEAFKFILNALKLLKVRRIITIDIHKLIEDNFIVNILPHELLGEKYTNGDFVIVAPDIGAIPRARAFSEYLHTELVTIDKVSGNTENIAIANGRNCLIVDDIIDTGRTIRNTQGILISAGAKHIEYCISSDIRNNLSQFHEAIAKIILYMFCVYCTGRLYVI